MVEFGSISANLLIILSCNSVNACFVKDNLKDKGMSLLGFILDTREAESQSMNKFAVITRLVLEVVRVSNCRQIANFAFPYSKHGQKLSNSRATVYGRSSNEPEESQIVFLGGRFCTFPSAAFADCVEDRLSQTARVAAETPFFCAQLCEI